MVRVLNPGSEALSREDAYALLVKEDLAPPRISREDKRKALVAHIEGDAVAGIQVATLDSEAARDLAYAALAETGAVEPVATEAQVDEALAAFFFYERYVGAPGRRGACGPVRARRHRTPPWRDADRRPPPRCAIPRLDLFPCRDRARHHLWRDAGHQHGPWRVHHDGRLHGLCGAALCARLHALDRAGPAPGLCRDIRRGRRDGASGDPLALPPAARDAAGDLRDLHRAPATCEEHLRHPGAAPDRTGLARRVVDPERRGLDQLHPDRDLRSGAHLPCALPLRDEPHPRGARGARGDAEPADGGVPWGSTPTGSTC